MEIGEAKDRLIEEMRENEKLRADLTAALAQLAEKEGQVCAIREALKIVVDDFEMRSPLDLQSPRDAERSTKCLAALTSSSPCAHAKEAERLRGAVEWALNELSIPSDPSDEHVEQHANEAVDSYCKWLLDELRRRAGGGKG